MQKVWNVIKLDMICIKRYFKLYAYLLCVALVFALVSKNIILSTTTMMLLISVRGVSIIFEIQDKYNCDKFYNFLPIDLKKIVVGRYLSIGLIGIIMLFVYLAILSIILSAQGVTISGNEIMISIGLGLMLLYCSILIQIPIFYKVGALQAKPFCFLPIIFYSLLVYIVNSTKLRNTVEK